MCARARTASLATGLQSERDVRSKVSLANNQPYDLIVIGGGITGVSLAFLATLTRPALRVALLESRDLASGTSGRSSRFLHGGLRYLAQGRVGLVRRLLRGRAELAGLVPHLVRPAPFLLPFGPGTPHPPWVLRAALGAYGILERGAPRVAGISRPCALDADEVRRREPLLAGLAPRGALAYGELTVDDAGLVRALAQAARAGGATVRTHAVCDDLARDGRGQVVGVVVHDARGGDPSLLRARVVVDARGPWIGRWNRDRGPDNDGPASDVTVRLARGTHLVLPAATLPLSHTVVFFAARDGRPLFASPRGRQVVVGTTDVPHTGTPDHVVPTQGEIDYLIESVVQAWPGVPLPGGTAVTAFAGVRALVMNCDAAGDASAGTAALDRDYAIGWQEPGLLAVRGGKLTLGLDGARRALHALRRQRRALGLPRLTVPAVGTLPGPLPAQALAAAEAIPDAAAVTVPSSSTGRAA